MNITEVLGISKEESTLNGIYLSRFDSMKHLPDMTPERYKEEVDAEKNKIKELRKNGSWKYYPSDPISSTYIANCADVPSSIVRDNWTEVCNTIDNWIVNYNCDNDKFKEEVVDKVKNLINSK